MKVKAKDLLFESLPNARKKKAAAGQYMEPGPKIPGLKNTLKNLPDDYFDIMMQPTQVQDPVPIPLQGPDTSKIRLPQQNTTPPGMVTQQDERFYKPYMGELGNAALFGMAAFDALLPSRYNKQTVVRPGLGYNPYQYGTGSQAIMQAGGYIPMEDDGNTPSAQAGGSYSDSLALYNSSKRWSDYVKKIKDPNSPITPEEQAFFKNNEASIKGILPNARPVRTENIGTRQVNWFKKPTPPNRELDATKKWYRQQQELSDSLKTLGPNPSFDVLSNYYDKHPRLEKISNTPPPKTKLIKHTNLGATNKYDFTERETRMRVQDPTDAQVRFTPASTSGLFMISRGNSAGTPTAVPFNNGLAKIPTPEYSAMNLSSPTNYSATYRDESSPTKDRTTYFRDKAGWQNFINSGIYNAASTSQTDDSATASGYINIPEGKSGIHIKPSKRGTLHDALGIPRDQKIPASKLKDKPGDSAAMKKKKNFARNARKWKHEDGGIIPDPMSVFNPHEYENGGEVGPRYPNADLLEQYIQYQQGGTLDPYYEASARLSHFKGILNDKLKAKNPKAFGDFFSGLKNLRDPQKERYDYVQNTPYEEFLSPDEVKSTLGDDYDAYLGSLKEVNKYNISQGRQPLYGQKEGESDLTSLNYGRRFASLQVTPSLSIRNQDKGTNYAREYAYDPATKSVNFKETGDLNLRPSYVKSPATSSIEKLASTKFGGGGMINSTGYLQGSPTASNPFNIIPGGDITMKGVNEPIMGMPINKGKLGKPKRMIPGQDYKFNSDAVFEYPAMQNGGVMYDDGGTMETMWGGDVNLASYNPYDGGMAEFKGASHADGGIGMHYNGNPVEVEGGEFASKDSEGNMNIYGNMFLPGTRTKFKSVAKEIADKEGKYSGLKTRGAELVNASNPANKFEQLTFNSGKVMMEGGEIGQKDLAIKKEKLARLQKAMLDTADEYGIDPQAMSKGKVSPKPKRKTAQAGGTLADRNNNPGNIKFGKFAEKYGAKKGAPGKDGGFFAIFPDQESGLKAMQDLLKSPSYRNLSIDQAIDKWTGGKPYNYNLDDISGKLVKDLNPEEFERTINTMRRGEGTRYPIESSRVTPVQKLPTPKIDFTPYGLPDIPLTPVQQPGTPSTVTPPYDYLQPVPDRPVLPSNVEPLHLNQALGEIYAAATNRVEPVPAQRYEPELFTPYEVSFQDRINRNQNAFNALRRTVGSPSALGTLAGQLYEANNAVAADEFRTNQGIANDVTNKNIALINDAQLKNLGIADTQMVRQSTAKSKTKAINQMIVNSLSGKYAQNDFENKRLAAYENLYDYRFVPQEDGGLEATYFGPNAMFNYNGKSNTGQSADDVRTISRYDAYGNLKGYAEYDDSELREAQRRLDIETKRRKLPLLTVPRLQ